MYTLFILVSILHFFDRVFEIKLHKKHPESINKEKSSFEWMRVFHLFYFFGAIMERIFFRADLDYFNAFLGLVMLIGSIVLRKWAIGTLGQSWSVRVEVHDEQELVRSGPYQFCRHPNYLAIIFEVIGFCLFANAYLVLLISAFCYGIIIAHRIKFEEIVLTKKYGSCYKDFIRSTDALIPSYKYFKRRRKANTNNLGD